MANGGFIGIPNSPAFIYAKGVWRLDEQRQSAVSSTWPYISAMDHIETITVGAGGAASVTFSSIPQTYKHLQLRYAWKSALFSSVNMSMRVNNDSGSNYASHILYGDGTTASSGANTSIAQAWVGWAGTVGGITAGVVDILDYASTSKYKTIRSLYGVDNNGSGIVAMRSNLWMNTGAITSLVIADTNSIYGQYSTFSLYGIRG